MKNLCIHVKNLSYQNKHFHSIFPQTFKRSSYNKIHLPVKWILRGSLTKWDWIPSSFEQHILRGGCRDGRQKLKEHASLHVWAQRIKQVQGNDETTRSSKDASTENITEILVLEYCLSYFIEDWASLDIMLYYANKMEFSHNPLTAHTHSSKWGLKIRIAL